MKAIVCERYGPPDVLKLKEVDKPIPRANEVLIRVRAATVLMGDCDFRGMKLPLVWMIIMRLAFDFRGPRKKILGQELAGEIESFGSDVKSFKKGDAVFAMTVLRFGAYAEYDCLPWNGLISVKPANASFGEAAALPTGGIFALHYLKQANISEGQKVLIIGAGGSIGTFAVQIAKSLGARVTAVDRAGKLEMLRSIGAEETIDYENNEYGEKYDVIFDAVGKSKYVDCRKSLKDGGSYLLANPSLSHRMRGLWNRSGKKVITQMAYRGAYLVELRELFEAGKIKTAIDRSYPLELVAEAHRYVETGQKRGNVVIEVPERALR
jgi:NADPH:quinone reductase-like Zn-dependent oxidoreductase